MYWSSVTGDSHVPKDFPARPPKVKFLSKWDNHQHLWGDRICHSLLTDDFMSYFQERRTDSGERG
eukprot:4865860-Amphidinium_carterae.1